MTDKELDFLRNNFRNAVGCCRKKLFVKKEYGIAFTFNRLSMNKIGCIKSVMKSVQNGYTPSEHFEAAENIKEFFERAEVVEQHYENKKYRCERHNLCICNTTGNNKVYMNVVTWGQNEGYIDLYLKKGAE